MSHRSQCSHNHLSQALRIERLITDPSHPLPRNGVVLRFNDLTWVHYHHLGYRECSEIFSYRPSSIRLPVIQETQRCYNQRILCHCAEQMLTPTHVVQLHVYPNCFFGITSSPWYGKAVGLDICLFTSYKLAWGTRNGSILMLCFIAEVFLS